MTQTDHLLTDPSRDRLLRTLAVGSRQALLDKILGSPEGSVEQSRGAVAWWTDHRGSKHVRIRPSALTRNQPPLRHIFPNRVYQVTQPGEPPCWLVSCCCGMTGTPEELAWMGERCGPCHDRREEGQPHPEDGRPTLFAGSAFGLAVRFSHDGRHLAASSGGYSLRLYDLASGHAEELSGYEDDLESQQGGHGPLAFSPDGRWLVGGLLGLDEWLPQWWDLHKPDEGSGELLVQQDRGEEEGRGFTFSPDGKLLASWSNRGHFIVMTAEGNSVPNARWRVSCYCTALAFSPDSQTLALGHTGWRVRFLDTQTWQESEGPQVDMHEEDEFEFLAYTPDGRYLVFVIGNPEQDEPTPRRLYVSDLEGDDDREATIPFHGGARALSKDGRYFAYSPAAEGHTVGQVVFFDLQEWLEAGRLAWDEADALRDMDFSPDGQTLATISAGGVVRLWPWRGLLGLEAGSISG